MRNVRILAITALLLLASMSTGRAEKLSIDPMHSQAVFTIEHVVGKVAGFFNAFDGTIDFDQAAPEKGTIDVSIGVASVNTGIDKRDAHLRTADFFDAEQYPNMHFVSSDIKATGDGGYEARGTLTIKDVRKQIVLPFTVLGTEKHPMPELKNKNVVGIEGHYAINRLDYHVGDGKFHKMGLVGDTVHITIYCELLSSD